MSSEEGKKPGRSTKFFIYGIAAGVIFDLLLLTYMIGPGFLPSSGCSGVCTATGFSKIRPTFSGTYPTANGRVYGEFINTADADIYVNDVIISDGSQTGVNDVRCRKAIGENVPPGRSFVFIIDGCGKMERGSGFNIRFTFEVDEPRGESRISREDTGILRGMIDNIIDRH
jgi:hypothetical protein